MNTTAQKDYSELELWGGEMEEWTKEERKEIPPKYGCEILYQNATLKEANDTSLPTDAYLVYYEMNGNIYMDVCRCKKKVDIFDMYYDKFGSGSLKKIEFGYGRVNPKLWNYQAPKKTKKRR